MKIFCDGSGFNGVTSSYCVMSRDFQVFKHEVFRKNYTNNEMEYRAMIKALELANDGDTVCSDSQLVVYQIAGVYKVKEEHLRILLERVKEILETKKNLSIEWVSRKSNVAGVYLERYK